MSRNDTATAQRDVKHLARGHYLPAGYSALDARCTNSGKTRPTDRAGGLYDPTPTLLPS
jgi:hypothetical protein